jgi:hypothetical protein
MARVDLLGSVNVIIGILYSEATKASILKGKQITAITA